MEVIEHHHLPRPHNPRPRGSLAQRLECWLQRPGTALAILLGSLLLTALAWAATRHFALEDARLRFERRTDDVHGHIERRMADYEAMLRAGVGLLAAHPQLTRGDWRRYVDTVQPQRHYPGIQGVGVTRLLQPDELTAHERGVRAEGFPEYSVRPAGRRERYTSIIYLEPFSDRNLRAFGYDMMSEPTRREAMLRAGDSGQPAMSGIVTLVQEDGRNLQPGFLLYLPVYQDRGDQLTGQRGGQLWGWVYAPFRVRDLMAGVLGQDAGRIALRLHEGSDAGAAAFYRSEGWGTQDGGDAPTQVQSDRNGRSTGRGREGAHGEPTRPNGPSELHQARTLNFAGRIWTIVYTGGDAETAPDTWQANLVAASGVSIDLLLFWSIASLARRKAEFAREVASRSAESEGRLATLTAVSGLSPDAVLVFERDGSGPHRLVFTNPAFSRWFGLRPEDLLGLSEAAVDEWLDGLTHAGETMPALELGDAHIVLAGPPRRVLERRQRASGHQRVYYFHDVTHETEVEELKNEFLTTAAHELRTPLASVFGFAELLAEGRVDESRRQRVTQIIHRQAAVLKHLVDELLDLARIDSLRGRDFTAQECDLRRVAELAAEGLMPPTTAARIRVEAGGTPGWVQADPAKLQQALSNVIGNALKYSAPETPVVVSLQRCREAGQDWLGLRVADQGIGMSAAQCARAFDRFYRADPSGHILGAGLGLSIVQEIMAIHQGRVALASTEGQGCTVTLWLPAPPVPAGAGPAQPVGRAPLETALTG